MANIDQELEDIRKMLGMDAPAVEKKKPAPPPKQNTSFDLDNILQEIGGVVQQTQAENAKNPIEIPVELGRIDVKHLVDAQDLEEAEQVIKKATPEPVGQGTMKMPKMQARPEGYLQEDITTRKAQPKARPIDPQEDMPAPAPKGRGGKRRNAPVENNMARPQTPIRTDDRTSRERERMREEDKHIHARDPRVGMRECVGRVRNLSLRIIVVGALAVVLLYLSIANTLGLPVSDSMNFATSTRSTALSMMLMQLVAMLFSVDVIGAGFYNLVTGRAERASLVTCACMATFLHSACLYLVGWGPYLPYCGISVCLLTLSLVEDRNRHAGRARAFKATMPSSPASKQGAKEDKFYTVVAHTDPMEGVCRTSKRDTETNEKFLLEMERPDTTEYFARIYVPIMLVACFVFSAISCYHREDYNSFLWTLSAVLSMASPLALIGAFGTAYARASRRLLEEGAAIANARSAISLRRAREVIITDTDLFPVGNIAVEEPLSVGNYAPEKLLAYVTAVAEACNLAMAPELTAMLNEQYGRPIVAQDVRMHGGGAISAMVQGDAFLMGTAAYMSQMQIPIIAERSEGTVLFLAINGNHVGSLPVKYLPSSHTYHSMQAFSRLRVHPVLAQYDCNITAKMVERLFDVKRGTVGEVVAARVDAVCDPAATADEPEGALLFRDNLAAVAQVHVSADRLSHAVRANLILGGFAGLCGSLLMFYLTFMGVYEAIIPLNVAIYLLLWYLPSLVITYSAGSGI